MTREEAIKILKAIRVYECYPKSASEETKEVIDMAIEALSAEAVQGEWVGLNECSVCGKQAFDFIEGWVEGVEYLPNFCPNCGTRMKPYKGGEDE